jgi:hypothetical protein
MQAITYAALVAGFSKATLADAHADYLNRRLESDKVSVADPANPRSDSQGKPGLRKVIRKVNLEFATFDSTRQHLSRSVEDCGGAPRLLGFAI